jgi:hypothetical protein
LSGVYAFIRRKEEKWAGVLVVFSLLLSFALITSFAVTDLDPLKFAQPLRVRYLLVTIPLAILVVCMTLEMLHFSMTAIAASILFVVWGTDYKENELKLSQWKPAITQINAYQKTISDHWHAGYALIFKNRKYAKLYRDVYLTDDILFKEDGNVEPVDLVHPAELNYTDTRQSRIYVIRKNKEHTGYLVLNHRLKIREKVSF